MPAIDGSRSLVVGGAHRVGRAVALDLAAGGADVAISYRSSAHAAEATRAEIAALGVRSAALRRRRRQCPRRWPRSSSAAAAELGGLDVVVYCPSGGFVPVAPQDVSRGAVGPALDSTAKGFMFAAQAAHRHMAAAGGGVIVAITDVAGLQPWPLFAPTAPPRRPRSTWSRRSRWRGGRDGVRVCGVAPGPVLMPGGERGATEETALGTIGDARRRVPGGALLHRVGLRRPARTSSSTAAGCCVPRPTA